MTLKKIPFEDVGIDQDIGDEIITEIDRLTGAKPDKSIDIQKVSELTEIPSPTVKRIFYILLGLRILSATFMPRHKKCGTVIGKQEQTVNEIYNKFESGDYLDVCNRCMEDIEGQDDIDIQIIFWRKS